MEVLREAISKGRDGGGWRSVSKKKGDDERCCLAWVGLTVARMSNVGLAYEYGVLRHPLAAPKKELRGYG